MSDKFFGIVMYLIMLPTIAIIAAMLGNETKAKKNIILGVTMPFAARSDERVEAICSRFRKRLWICSAIIAIAGLPILFVPWFSVQLTLYLVWILIEILLPMLLYIKAHRQLRDLKRERGWFVRREGGSETVVDISVAAAPKKPLSPWWFLPPLVVSLIPVALALTKYRAEEMTAYVVLGLSFAGTVLLSWVLYPVIFRLRTDVAGGDSRVNAALTNVRRVSWGRAWIYIAWSTAVMGLAAWIFRDSELGQLITILAYCFVLMRLCVWTEMGLRREQERLTAAERADYIDEDCYWPLGMFYNNPNDSHLTVNDRVGMNMTVNLGRPAGKMLMGLTALLVAAMPLVGVWVMGVEFSPTRVETGETSLSVTRLTKQFEIDYEDIEVLELLDDLPTARRVSGTRMDSLLQGSFTVEGYGKCTLCLDPATTPLILLQTEDTTYIFNGDSPEETLEAYSRIRSESNA